MTKFLKIFLFIIPFVWLSCHNNSDKTIIKSFCYWKTDIDLDSTDIANLKKLEIQHFYIRFFDVDWDIVKQRAVPVSTCDIHYRFDYYADITPVVFITNAVFENIKTYDMENLATHVLNKVNYNKNILFNNLLESNIYATDRHRILEKKYHDNYAIVHQYDDSLMQCIGPNYFKRNNEILIDCDWTPSTKVKYFSFLRVLKSKAQGCEISSTLRLWQYRDYKLAGVPPVKKCLLMCYNLSDPRKYETQNSIATLDDFKNYINHKNYDRHIDIVLPLHTWGVYFRNGRFKGLVNGISETEISENKLLFDPIAPHRYKFLCDTVINDTYYRNGDELRLEEVSFPVLLEFAKQLHKYLKTDKSTRLSFFSWDSKYYKRLSKDEYSQLYKAIAY